MNRKYVTGVVVSSLNARITGDRGAEPIVAGRALRTTIGGVQLASCACAC